MACRLAQQQLAQRCTALGRPMTNIDMNRTNAVVTTAKSTA
ncbi:hypothetical protein OG436_10680 [Streptomyces caniferus]|uniref:Uncharacterized protein n=1 Tax=Streptomyces caniferus TaxID=285557 RepID=A0ABZ1VRA6_9ACTN|nr:hypothetical protein [Streptomyces caniferus]